jgi:hypothetical protein
MVTITKDKLLIEIRCPAPGRKLRKIKSALILVSCIAVDNEPASVVELILLLEELKQTK